MSMTGRFTLFLELNGLENGPIVLGSVLADYGSYLSGGIANSRQSYRNYLTAAEQYRVPIHFRLEEVFKRFSELLQVF